MADRLSVRLKKGVLIAVNPIVLALTFWAIDLGDSRLWALPLLGLLLHTTGGLAGLAGARRLGLPPGEAAGLVLCGGFSNLGFIGGLFAFTLFGEPGYALLSLFRLPEQPLYYGLGYPIADYVAHGRVSRSIWELLGKVFRRPPVFMPLAGLSTGLALHLSGMPRPPLLGALNQILIPVSVTVILFSIGLNLKGGPLRRYLPACAWTAAVKFLLLPAVVGGAAYLAGLSQVQGGMPLRVAVLAACMPVAFNALVPPAILNFNQDLPNSCWLFTTALGILIIPLLSAFLTA